MVVLKIHSLVGGFNSHNPLPRSSFAIVTLFMSYRGWDDMEKLPGQLCDLSEFKDSDIGVVPIYLPAGRARGRYVAAIAIEHGALISSL